MDTYNYIYKYICMYVCIYMYMQIYVCGIQNKKQNKHRSMFQLLSYSRTYRVTFEIFFIYILYKIVHNKLMHLFHYIGEILYYPSNYAGKKILLIILQNICLVSFSKSVPKLICPNTSSYSYN